MEREVILVATFTLIILVVIIIIFFVIFQTKKNNYIIDRHSAEQKIEQEIAKSQMEIQEQSFKNIGWELHDNVGQILSTAKMQLSILQRKLPEEHKQALSEIGNLIGDSLHEIRLLSKTLNHEVVSNLGLVKSVGYELERFNRLNFLKASLSVKGNVVPIDGRDEIIIFRILQEFFSNVVRHSKATELTVIIEFFADRLEVAARDNGVGFDPEKTQVTSGLINMKSRALMAGATYSIRTAPNEGVNLILCYTFREQKTKTSSHEE
ncbi:sensor histidine kinase [Pseudochryseolinea flava]|uniref:histidine kinase n=1 Tax=Pseudochryseolinea flava TaxID=2059302 RepID=A0A364XWD8_9BACT|nr:histidine kinase [Pseudochryseolinea flava]RAV98468.1 histidine kinase [Pseudochryseolinea flava]